MQQEALSVPHIDRSFYSVIQHKLILSIDNYFSLSSLQNDSGHDADNALTEFKYVLWNEQIFLNPILMITWKIKENPFYVGHFLNAETALSKETVHSLISSNRARIKTLVQGLATLMMWCLVWWWGPNRRETTWRGGKRWLGCQVGGGGFSWEIR